MTKIDFDSNNEDPNGKFQCNIDEADRAQSVIVEPEDSAKANHTADVASDAAKLGEICTDVFGAIG